MDDKCSELWKTYKKNQSIRNRNKLICFYLPFIGGVIKKYFKPVLKFHELSELVDITIPRIIRSIFLFESTRKIPFEVYLRGNIIGAVKDYLRTLDFAPRSERLKPNYVSEMNWFTDVESELNRHNKTPINYSKSIESKNESLQHKLDRRRIWRKATNNLTRRDRLILRRLYKEGKMNVEIARELKIHPSAITLIHRRLKRKLALRLKDYVGWL